MNEQRTLADAFRRLHQPDAGRILVLPNAWDAMSARVIEEAGARAIATTSAGVAWALGRTDGEGLTRDQMINAVERITRVVRVPVTADVERGYGDGTPADVAETVRRVIGAGAVGINLEDAPGRDGAVLMDADEQVERIAAAREAAGSEGVEIYINARIDPYLAQAGAPEGRFDETVRRAQAYVAAGADGVFVPGVADAETIRALAAAVRVPLNVMAGRGAGPGIAALQALGVARVSIGPAMTLAVMGQIRRAAAEVLEQGTFTALGGGLPFPEANALFHRGGEG
ncbi:MAG TPA: isocitrate lyase/phosphoenolpyruvate mutase family protein [Longimicrobium sp.]|nr:isocitrate lyase/phosphoenolpyruvate mutase family protein [Longimicrobium sp.]